MKCTYTLRNRFMHRHKVISFFRDIRIGEFFYFSSFYEPASPGHTLWEKIAPDAYRVCIGHRRTDTVHKDLGNTSTLMLMIVDPNKIIYKT